MQRRPILATATCLALALAASAAAAGEAPPESGTWIQLFNGKDLQGWRSKITGYPLGQNFGNTFRVENGVLKVVYDPHRDGRQTRHAPL